MPEQDICRSIARILQRHCNDDPKHFIFFKLEKCHDNQSKIIWSKNFQGFEEQIEFFHDTKFMRACIMIRGNLTRYKLICNGFYFSSLQIISADEIDDSRSFSCSHDIEQIKMFYKEVPDSLKSIALELKQRTFKS